ncbi:hypothetical protein Ancab_038035 [Ancistrocladus abbreviatus]
MKIFNWVHRRFCHNFNSSTISIQEDGLSRNSIQTEPKHQRDNETKALLEDNDLPMGMIENWKLDGILAIGTLCIDPLESPDRQNEFKMDEEDYGKDEFHEEKHNYTCKHEGGETVCFPVHNQTLDLSSILEGNIDLFKLYLSDQREALKCSEIEGVDEEKGKEKKNDEGKRVTLAELFLADPDVKAKAYVKPICAKKPTVFRAKQGPSKPKKLLPQAKENLRPLKKLHQFMTRMMKTKIHPELGESRSQKRDNQFMEWSANPNHEQHRAAETVSLLHTQSDVVV